MSDVQSVNDIIDTKVRVMTWNVWWRFGPWEAREPAILEEITAHIPDVVALQEVWGDGSTSFAASVAAELGFSHVYAPSMDINGDRFGNAIVSRWPIGDSDSEALFGKDETGEGRNVLYCRIDGPRGSIPVFCTHLNWKFHHCAVRKRQVSGLLHFVNKHQNAEYPPIVCGDFNSVTESDEIRMLTGMTEGPVEGLIFHDAWVVAGTGDQGATWNNSNPYAAPEFEPDRRIDYIFAGWPGSGGSGHVTDCRLIGNQPREGVWPSDHFGLLAELRY